MTGSVGPTPHFRKIGHMNAIGIVVALLLAIVLIPLWPFVAILWLATRLRGSPEETGETAGPA